MLRVLGGPKRFCDGLTRRELLQVGSLGLLGLGLPQLASSVAGTGRAPAGLRACRGSARRSRASCCSCTARRASSRRSTPSPTLPLEIRGELGCIPSSVPGLNVCERLPRLAQVMDKVTLIRSVSHPYPIHGVAFATTGNPADRHPDGAEPARPEPLAVHRLGGRPRRRTRQAGEAARPAGRPAQPRASLGVQQPARRRGGPRRARTAVSWARRTTRSAPSSSARDHEDARKTLADQVWEDLEPYRGITPESRFQLGAVSQLGPELTLDRLDRRRTLLEQIEQFRREADAAADRIGHRPPSRDGLRPARLGEAAPGVRPGRRSRTRRATSTA